MMVWGRNLDLCLWYDVFACACALVALLLGMVWAPVPLFQAGAVELSTYTAYVPCWFHYEGMAHDLAWIIEDWGGFKPWTTI